jgi:methyl-accepting chemotaxis protein
MHEWNMMLANQSVRLVDNFGLSVDRLRSRQEELMNTGQELEKGEAFVAAAMELATERVKELNDANVEAVTSTDRLAAARQNLKYVIGEQLAEPTAAVRTVATEAINNVTQAIALNSPEATTKLNALNKEIEDTKDLIADLEGPNRLGMDGRQ